MVEIWSEKEEWSGVEWNVVKWNVDGGGETVVCGGGLME